VSTSVSKKAPTTELVRAFWDACPDGLAIVGTDDRICHANAAFCRLFGHGDATLGMPLRELYLAEADWERAEATRRGDAPGWSGSLRFGRVDGSVLTAQVSLSQLVADPGGAPSLAVSVREVDPSERDRELHVLRQRMEGNLSSTPLAVVEWDVEGKIVGWNRSAERIFGWQAAEAIGKPFLPLIVPDLAQDQVKGIVAALLSGEFANSRNVNITKDGRSITCQWYNTLLQDEQGEVVGVHSQADDVTEVERVAQSLRESQQLLTAILDNLPACLAVKAVDGRYLLFNHALEQLHARPRDEVMGRREHELWSEEVAAARVAGHEQALAAGRPVEREEVIVGPDGPRTFTAVDFPVYAESGAVSGVCRIAVDITERRRAVEERAVLQQRVIDAQQSALRELSTPLIPLADGVVLMPLIGLVDRARAMLIMEALLAGISGQRARAAILDITGVRVLNAEAAGALMMVARAARLLGAAVILAGVSPSVALALTDSGADLRGIVTVGTLETGIAHALATSQRST
jgi:PAS domain S-box-containing protein